MTRGGACLSALAWLLAAAVIPSALAGCAPPAPVIDDRGSGPPAAPRSPPDLGGLAPLSPPAVSADPGQIELGRLLFFDPRLSGSGSMSCATCHDPAKGFADGLPLGRGHHGKTLSRHSPALMNLAGREPYFWDGRAETLEAQALMPIESGDEMAGDVDALLVALEAIPEYAARFEVAFGREGITRDTLARAIAAFERGLVSADAPFDRHARGDRGALSEEATLGLQLFTGKGRCVKCHDGPLLSDNGFHNIGLAGSDIGRAKIVPVAAARGAFKTPSLRDVELTAPYFHDGSAATLGDVLDHYDRGGVVKDNLDADIRPLGLTPREREALVAFLRSLTGKVAPAPPPVLPRVVDDPGTSLRQVLKAVDATPGSTPRHPP